jgi:hypothetical protein
MRGVREDVRIVVLHLERCNASHHLQADPVTFSLCYVFILPDVDLFSLQSEECGSPTFEDSHVARSLCLPYPVALIVKTVIRSL